DYNSVHSPTVTPYRCQPPASGAGGRTINLPIRIEQSKVRLAFGWPKICFKSYFGRLPGDAPRGLTSPASPDQYMRGVCCPKQLPPHEIREVRQWAPL